MCNITMNIKPTVNKEEFKAKLMEILDDKDAHYIMGLFTDVD